MSLVLPWLSECSIAREIKKKTLSHITVYNKYIKVQLLYNFAKQSLSIPINKYLIHVNRLITRSETVLLKIHF